MVDVGLDLPDRHPLQRARFFLQKAEQCDASQLDAFEAYLDAAIVFGRSAMQWLQPKYKGNSEWKKWFNSLKNDPSIKFFKDYRDVLLHKHTPKYHQIINMGGSAQGTRATELYYFEDPGTPATETVRGHLENIAERVAYAEDQFSPVSEKPD